MGSNGTSSPHDPVTAYAESVVAGVLVAGELVRLACERHLRDLKTADTRGLHWDLDAALHAIEFFPFLRHSKAEWAGARFELAPWQDFIVGSLFGWKRADGFRRFRTAYNEVPRKNGKSTFAAGIGLYLFVADGEPGAEIYTGATKRDQARIVHGEAVRMVRKSPGLRKRIGIHKDNLFIEDSASFYRPLGADADTMDGLNPQAAILDELHAHKKRAMWDVIDTAMGSRRQPMLFAITTAGVDRETVCFEQRIYAEGILKGTTEDDSYFAYIATLDDGDDWTSEAAWRKANPNYGVSVKPDDLKRLCAQALQMPSKQNAFLRLRLNKWTQQVDRWIPMELWDQQAGVADEAALKRRRCYGGLDLSSNRDMTAWVLVFPQEDDPETVDVLARFWVPEARIEDPRNIYRDQYQRWVADRFLRTTPGEAIDHEFVKKQIIEDAKTFQLVDLNFDRWGSTQVSLQLQDEGLEVVGFGQGFASMSAPMKEFERRLIALKIRHGGNPVLRWQADNVAVQRDSADNLKPNKAKSQGKIDGIVALVMALDRAMRHQPSVYEKRGLLAVGEGPRPTENPQPEGA